MAGRTLQKSVGIAKYINVREGLVEDLNAQGAVELSMIDMMGQSFFQYLYWMEQAVIRSQTEERRVDGSLRKWLAEQQQQYGKDIFPEGFWHRPTVSEVEAIDHAAKMAERFHRTYMRTLEQMSDHRKYSPVKIANAKQVNIATNGGHRSIGRRRGRVKYKRSAANFPF